MENVVRVSEPKQPERPLLINTCEDIYMFNLSSHTLWHAKSYRYWKSTEAVRITGPLPRRTLEARTDGQRGTMIKSGVALPGIQPRAKTAFANMITIIHRMQDSYAAGSTARSISTTLTDVLVPRAADRRPPSSYHEFTRPIRFVRNECHQVSPSHLV